MNGIFLNQDGVLLPLSPASYSAELVLQKMVAEHPELLGGGQDGGSLLLVRREAGIADGTDVAARWSVDHLFLDAAGVPVLVEVKRSTDTRIRREVVGQMLDYAAGAAHWTVEQIQGWLAQRCTEDGLDHDRLLTNHTDDQDGFWQQVATNIGARKLRLVFVADVIPPELRAIVEFLNEQMTSCEVLAVEIKQYLDSEGRQTIVVPTVLGQTQQARAVKHQRAQPLPWDLGLVLEATKATAGEQAADVIQAVADWAARQPDLRVAFGRGATRRWGSLQVLLDGAPNVSPFVFWANGGVEMTFQYMIASNWAPFDQEDLRRQLAARLNDIPDAQVLAERLALRPSIPLTVVGGALPQFLAVMDWTFEQARSARDNS
jgi:hypothetical protein